MTSFVSNYVLNLAPIALGRQPQRPLLFSYYITHQCHLNCRYCCDGDGKRFREDPIPELSTDEARRLVQILARAADTLDITGGEPLLRTDLEEVLAEARRSGMRTVLNTKGIGLSERPELLDVVDVLVISIDTLDPRRLAVLLGRPQAVAKEVLRTLEWVMARPRGVTQLVLSAVATPDNLADVEEVLNFADRHGLGFHVSPEIVGTAVNPALRGNEPYRRLIDLVIDAKQRQTAVLGISAYLEGIRDFRQFRCHPLLMPAIRPDGRLYYPCLEHREATVNILEAGDYSVALRQARAEQGEIPQCRDCCHIFCHMALSLLQRRPLAALSEGRTWQRRPPATAGSQTRGEP